MHKHTDYICTISLHCVILNAFPNGLFDGLHSCIGCICLAFLLCVFLDGSSNCQPEWMYNCKSCIFQMSPQITGVYWSILTKVTPVKVVSSVSFQMWPQCTWIRACIVTLVAFVRLFSTVLFQMACSRRGLGDIGCICSFDFSRLCVFKCVLKLLAWDDAKSHWLHLFDFSPLCVFRCALKLPREEEA